MISEIKRRKRGEERRRGEKEERREGGEERRRIAEKEEKTKGGEEKRRRDRGRADLRLVIQYNALATSKYVLRNIVLAGSPSYCNIPTGDLVHPIAAFVMVSYYGEPY